MARRTEKVQALLEAEGLTVRRRGGRAVVENAAFALRPEEIVDLEGPSGTGKSSLLLALARLVPREGRLFCAGRPADVVPPPQWRSAVAYVAQRPAALPGTVFDNLVAAFRLGLRANREAPDRAALRAALDRLGLDSVDLAAPADRLSGGELARVAFLRAWLTGPKVLLLDEAEAMLDPEAAKALQSMQAEFCGAGGAVLRVSHHGPAGGRKLRLAGGRLEDGP